MNDRAATGFQFTTRSVLILTTLVAIWLVLFGVFNWQSQIVLAVMFGTIVLTREITRTAAITLSLAMLLPYTWVFWAPGSYSDYRMFWLSSWPVLPGLIPSHRWFMHYSEWFEIFMSGVFTLVAWAICVSIGRLGRGWLIGLTVLVTAASVVLAIGSYAAFRA